MKSMISLFAIVFFLAGCATNISPQTYSIGSVGQVNRTIPGRIISAREIEVLGTTHLGGSSGAAAGAVIGSGAGGGNNRGGLVGAIGGAVAGGLAGASIEANATKQKGMEYVVESENGNLMTLVQGADVVFVVGQRVLILYGSPSRLIADPRSQ